MRTKTTYSIESDLNGTLAEYDFTSERDVIETVQAVCEREYKESAQFEYNADGFSFEISDQVGDIDEVTIYFQEVELTFEQELSAVLSENRIAHTVASTGSIYVKCNIEGFEGIRIADHNPNGRNPYCEVNSANISNIDVFVSSLQDAINLNSVNAINSYIYLESI